jgi:hypothetical protein
MKIHSDTISVATSHARGLWVHPPADQDDTSTPGAVASVAGAGRATALGVSCACPRAMKRSERTMPAIVSFRDDGVVSQRETVNVPVEAGRGQERAMEMIGHQTILSFSADSDRIGALTCRGIRKRGAHRVRNYMDLATKVAELQFHNRDHFLMFRGQHGDHRNRSGHTSLKPSLMRAPDSAKTVTERTVERRFRTLVAAEQTLVAEYRRRRLVGRERLERQRILRWAILQHYEICRTPLLDVTQSLRIAASFASNRATRQGYVLVLGIPHVSGAVTASAETGLQVVCLASVCPPTAVRPHIQEGYLLGEYPDFTSAEQQLFYSHAEMDFGRRLIAKFCFDPDRFWDERGNFPQVAEHALYPGASQDPMWSLAAAVKSAIADRQL